ncbi:MAG: Resolvase protein [Firmicutes bacterium]|nr:Resolvase protein [Bacillota bacterium]
MNAAIYVRVSTEQQAEKGYSLDTQLDACRKYALELGATDIVEFVDDGYSGEFIDRPALTSLREKLKNKLFQVVIAYAPDRLARKTIHLLIISEEISKAGALRKFASVNFESTSEGELMYKFQGIVAEYEKEKIKERTMRGKRGKASKGLVISNAKPFGYSFDSAKSTYVINESDAKIIKMIFDFIVKEKIGTALICKELNARGIPSPRAKKAWIISSVHRIITNSLYKGVIYSMKYRYEKVGLTKRKRSLRPESEWIPISVPAIIDEATWQAAQKQLQANKNSAKRNLKYDYLLNGIVICAKCGRAMIISHSGCKNFISYYTCLSHKSSAYLYSGQKPCNARQIPTKILDDYVFNYLFELCYNPVQIEDYFRTAPPKEYMLKQKIALDQMVRTEKELLHQKQILLRWFQQQILTEDETEIELKSIHTQLAEIAHLRTAYTAELTIATLPPSISEITAIIRQNFDKETFSTDDKKNALRAVVAQVVVERIDDTRGRGSRPEINVQLKLK